MRKWTRGRLATILRTNKLQVPAAWPFATLSHLAHAAAWSYHMGTLGMLSHPTLPPANSSRLRRYMSCTLESVCPHCLKRFGKYLTFLYRPLILMLLPRMTPFSYWSPSGETFYMQGKHVQRSGSRRFCPIYGWHHHLLSLIHLDSVQKIVSMRNCIIEICNRPI